ncbi:MAG: DUF4080 domain-containing protein, partial [Pseudomonadota bacterium]
PLLAEFLRLIQRGARHFKFVDRTFNVRIEAARRILEFFLEHYRPGMFLHFEVVPDRLPTTLRGLISRFPVGALQFEMGIQTFNPRVGTRIRRRQNEKATVENLRFLRNDTGAYIHADLIAGLPGENLKSFAAGFDRLVKLCPQEIQVGILKRLKGTTIGRHDRKWGMVYRKEAPFDLLENSLLDSATMERLRHFARFWDLVSNSGRFIETAPRIWDGARSPFRAFLKFSDWLYSGLGRSHSIPQRLLAERLFRYLTDALKQPADEVTACLASDFGRSGSRDVPGFLKAHVPARPPAPEGAHAAAQARQRRHAGAATRRSDPA